MQMGGAEGQGSMMMPARRMWHWHCCIIPLVSLLMWLAAIVFVVLSWISVMDASGSVWGYGPQWWIWNAVMFGILSIYGGRRKFGRHGMCGCKEGCMCKEGMCTCK